VNNGARRAPQCLECAANQRLASLRQHLHGNIRRNAPRFDQFTAKIKIRLRGGGKSHFDFLETQLDQQIEHFVLALRIHRVNQRLISVAQVNAAPDRRLVDDFARPSAVVQLDGWSRRVLGYWILQVRSFLCSLAEVSLREMISIKLDAAAGWKTRLTTHEAPARTQ